jgi:dTDP-4-dehydrorhamnose 3,5-epimerase
MFKILKTKFYNVQILISKRFKDKRGFFSEIYQKKEINKILNKKIDFVQINYAFSKKSVLRGLHFQTGRYAQEKIIRVLKGKIFDVIVDMDPKSKNFGKYFSCILSKKNKKMLFIPKLFAHGYLSLEKNTEIEYITTNYYSKKNEKCLIWNDEHVNIKWPNRKFIISKKDRYGKQFNKIFNKKI